MKINAPFVEKILTRFIRQELSRKGFQKAVLGLSGGLDSSVCAFLAVRALKAENVLGLIMPYGTAFSRDVEDAGAVARALDLRTEVIDIAPMVDSYYAAHPADDKLLRGNKMARERMSILYDYSAREKALVLGTSNKTELLLGYGTIYGDMACAFNPVGDLYKTQMRMMAHHLGMPDPILKKSPTAGLWEGQTDEEELGMSYELIDRILLQLVDLRRTPQEIAADGFKKQDIERIMGLIKASEFKRHLPPIAKIFDRTVGHDFLYPYDREK